MLYLTEHDAAFLHIPKCAGFWVEEALLRLGVAVKLRAHPRDPLQADRHARLADFSDTPTPRHVFAFVRHPFRWLESWWKYTNGRPHNWDRWEWHPTYPLQACRSLSFDYFVRCVLKSCPGFVGNLFSQYVGDEANPIATRVGRVETIVADMEAMLAEAGVPVPPGVLPAIPPIHTTQRVGTIPEWREKTLTGTLAAEADAMRRWYGNA